MEVFYTVRNKKFNAYGVYEKGNLTVLKGSRISESFDKSFKFTKDALDKRNISGLVKNCILQEDVSFRSASTAAQFVCGYSVNGKAVWKDASGKSIKDIEK